MEVMGRTVEMVPCWQEGRVKIGRGDAVVNHDRPRVIGVGVGGE